MGAFYSGNYTLSCTEKKEDFLKAFGEDGADGALAASVFHFKEIKIDVLMLAYMNNESLLKTLESGTTWFYSRSRQQLWNKGEASGNYQVVREIRYDCDGDTLLIKVDQKGVACHTGAYSCFFNNLVLESGVNEEIQDNGYKNALKIL